jgi:hypothetical protein
VDYLDLFGPEDWKMWDEGPLTDLGFPTIDYYLAHGWVRIQNLGINGVVCSIAAPRLPAHTCYIHLPE